MRHAWYALRRIQRRPGFAAAIALLFAATFATACGPTRRAPSIDPAETLRRE